MSSANPPLRRDRRRIAHDRDARARARRRCRFRGHRLADAARAGRARRLERHAQPRRCAPGRRGARDGRRGAPRGRGPRPLARRDRGALPRHGAREAARRAPRHHAAPGPHRLPHRLARRRGGHLGQRLRHAARRLDLPLLPRVWRRAVEGHAAAALHRQHVRQPERPGEGPSDARPLYVAARALRLGQLAHRHADHAGRGLRLGRQAQERPARGAGLLRRGRDQLERVPQRHELRGGVQDAHGLLLPQQRLGHQRAHRAADGERELRAEGRRLRRARGEGRRQRSAGGHQGDARGGGPRRARRGARPSSRRSPIG
jgi:hypothetical protein